MQLTNSSPIVDFTNIQRSEEANANFKKAEEQFHKSERLNAMIFGNGPIFDQLGAIEEGLEEGDTEELSNKLRGILDGIYQSHYAYRAQRSAAAFRSLARYHCTTRDHAAVRKTDVIARTTRRRKNSNSRLRKKKFPQPAPSLWSLPEGEKLRKAAFFYPGRGTSTSA